MIRNMGHITILVKDYEEAIKFYGEPKQVPWGVEVVFEDLYGNRFDLIEPVMKI
ncbi:hypothetical protein [Aneurinibacillus tyrosinisolvens]|uniref:hypothetical protein n=1 Tax=Aneurinibacillus tyrosinisolvens TaxID=1443435 RepID=UPI000ABAC602|nr:hypothetical protein [Aneurinibacillus tyrosinisolvens]